MREENKTKNSKEYNQSLQSLDKYIIEQSNLNIYEDVINMINTQLCQLLKPLAAFYGEYRAEYRDLQIKCGKSESGVLDNAFKMSAKDNFPAVTPVEEAIYEKLISDNIVFLSNQIDVTGGAVPDSPSASIGRALDTDSYILLPYMIDSQLYGISVIALKHAPDHSFENILKTYACFTSLSLKRVLAEEASRQSEQELRAITESMSDLIVTTDAQGKITLVKGNHLELLGYDNEELLGRSVLEMVHAEDSERIVELFRKHISAGEDGRAEYRAVRKDGTLVWVDTAGSVLQDNGEIRGALFVTRDISERKKAEEALKDSEKRNSAILGTLPDLMFISSRDGCYLDCHASDRSLLAAEPELFLGSSAREVLPPAVAEMFLRSFERVYETGELQIIDYPLEVPDGSKHFEARIAAMDEQRLIVIIRDVTDQKEKEKLIKENEQRLDTFISKTPVVIYSYKLIDGMPLMTYVNDNIKHVLGFRPADIINDLDFLGKCVHPEDIDKLLDDISRLKTEARITHEGYRLKDSQGNYRWVHDEQQVLGNEAGIVEVIGAWWDITDRKISEEKIKKLAQIADIAPNSILVHDYEGNIFYANEHTSVMYYYTEAEIMKLNLKDILDPENAELIMARMEEIVERGEARFESGGLRKDGSYFPKEVYVKQTEWYGKPALLSVSTDITDRKKSEEALKLSEEKYRQIAENISDLVWTTDTELNMTYVSPSVKKIIGDSVSDYLAKPVEERHPPDSLRNILSIFKEELEKDKSYQYDKQRTRVIEAEHYKADGSTIWMSMHVSFLRDEEGVVTGVQGVSRDISESKQMEKEIMEARDKYESLVNHMPGIAYRCKYDKYWTMLYISDDIDPITGYPAREFINNSVRTYESVIHREDTDYVNKTIDMAIEKKQPWSIDYRVHRQDGIVRWVNEKARGIYDEGGQVLFIDGLILDITEQKELDEKIKYMSFHDQLTDLYNRHYFESCQEDLKSVPVLSVIMTDVNGLKLINDTYGSQIGDEVLKKYAALLKQSFKQGDLIFRWGGDEFIVILKHTREARSWELCNRLIKHCGETFIKDIPLSVSVGISLKIQGEDINQAIKEAEDAMYKNKLKESRSSKYLIMKTLQQTLSEKSYETKEHIDRMTLIGRQFGEKLGLSPSELSRLETLVMLHDIGKINIHEHILLKETALDNEEWEEIKTHPEVGCRITRAAEEFAYVAEDILAHHERWDGKGYPQGLEGERIPYLARILNLIDSYDVMSNGRPYKKKMSLEAIIEEIQKCSGGQFDPELAERFIAFLKKGFAGQSQN